MKLLVSSAAASSLPFSLTDVVVVLNSILIISGIVVVVRVVVMMAMIILIAFKETIREDQCRIAAIREREMQMHLIFCFYSPENLRKLCFVFLLFFSPELFICLQKRLVTRRAERFI